MLKTCYPCQSVYLDLPKVCKIAAELHPKTLLTTAGNFYIWKILVLAGENGRGQEIWSVWDIVKNPSNNREPRS